MPPSPRRESSSYGNALNVLVELGPLINDYLSYHLETGQLDINSARLIKLARTFDEQVISGIGYPQVVMGAEAEPVLEHMNRGTRLTPGGRNFTEVITHYYEGLKKNIEEVVLKVRTEGISYLMMRDETGDHFNSKASSDIEELSKRFTWASDEVREQLCFRSDNYVKIEDNRKQRLEEMTDRFRRLNFTEAQIPSAQKHVILGKLQRIVHSISDGSPPMLIANDLMLVTSDLLHYLGQNHGEKGLSLVGEKKGVRPLDAYKDISLQQLEMMLKLLNNMIRDYEDCVVLHRDLLLGAGKKRRKD